MTYDKEYMKKWDELHHNYLKRYENKEFVKPKYSKLTKRNHSPHQRIAEWAVNA